LVVCSLLIDGLVEVTYEFISQTRLIAADSKRKNQLIAPVNRYHDALRRQGQNAWNIQ